MEIWKDVKGYEGLYQVSNQGRVKSFKRYPNGKVLKATPNSRGYKQVRMYFNGESYYEKVHVLVAQEFIGERPEDLVIDHIDDNKLNNNVNNLRYVTQKENAQKYFNSIKKINFV